MKFSRDMYDNVVKYICGMGSCADVAAVAWNCQ